MTFEEPTFPQEFQSWPQVSYEAVGQWENWQTLLDMANAIRYGFTQYRLPKPGTPVDMQETTERMEKIEKEWAWEHTGRGNQNTNPCPRFAQMPLAAQAYLHNALRKDGEPTTPAPDPENTYII